MMQYKGYAAEVDDFFYDSVGCLHATGPVTP